MHDRMHDSTAPLLVDAVRDLPPGRALDLACGTGRHAVWLAERGWEVVAIDGSSEAIATLRERDPRVYAQVMDLETGAPLPFEDESFDLVAILYYLHRPLFAEAKRVLKRGGTIVTIALMTGRFKAEPGELAQAFADFEIVRYAEGEVAQLFGVRRPEPPLW